MPRVQKIYVFADEAGQDTRGRIFVVGVVVAEELEALRTVLVAIERITRKGSRKWHNTRPDTRQHYFEAITRLPEFCGKLFVSIYRDESNYIELTAKTISKAILSVAQKPYEATVTLDGLSKQEINSVRNYLHRTGVRLRKVRGISKRTNEPFIRLADALCGLVRHRLLREPWTAQALKKLVLKGILRRV